MTQTLTRPFTRLCPCPLDQCCTC